MTIKMAKTLGSVDHIAETAITLAKKFNQTVEFEFNGQTNWARPESCAYDIAALMLLRQRVAQLEAKCEF